MSLRVWLPLTKDLRQQGLDNVTVTNNGATYSATSGKLGGCYSFGTGASALSLPASTFTSLTGDFSITCWVKIISWNTSYATVWAATSTSASYANIIAGMFRNSTSSKILFCIGNNSSSTQTSCMTTNDVSLNVWNHFVCTYTAGKILLYQNGELVSSYNTSIIPAFSTTQYVNIGKMRENTYQSNCSVNDFRIYDHCLSPMEVKELAKGLVLHYPLNRQGWGQENLITNSKLDGSWAYPSSSYSDKYSPITTIVPSATQYTLSFDAKSTVNGDKMRTHYYSPNTTTTCVSSQGTTKTAADGNMDFTLTTQWKRYWVIYTQTETTAVKHLICPRLVSGQGTGTVSVKNVKFEEGSIATPWCPNSSDALATTMGLNSTIEYDCSGFCNNGTRIGTFTWTSDAAKYQVSQIFNGSDNAIQTPNLTTMVTDKNYTVACWTYKTVIGTKNYQTIYGGPSGFELEARSSSSTSPLYRIHNWGGGTTAYNFGEWTHFCFVHTDSDSKLYVNGVLKITGSSANVPSGNYFVGAWNTSTSQNYEGNMSDFRIYATALSASDVKSLYQNCATIDPDGTIRGQIRS